MSFPVAVLVYLDVSGSLNVTKCILYHEQRNFHTSSNYVSQYFHSLSFWHILQCIMTACQHWRIFLTAYFRTRARYVSLCIVPSYRTIFQICPKAASQMVVFPVLTLRNMSFPTFRRNYLFLKFRIPEPLPGYLLTSEFSCTKCSHVDEEGEKYLRNASTYILHDAHRTEAYQLSKCRLFLASFTSTAWSLTFLELFIVNFSRYPTPQFVPWCVQRKELQDFSNTLPSLSALCCGILLHFTLTMLSTKVWQYWRLVGSSAVINRGVN
jgi:hypothetical protein